MQKSYKRAFPRIEIESLVSYLMVDSDKCVLGQGIGKVLNLSQSGLLLETSEPVEAPFILLSLADTPDRELTILGQVAFSCERGPAGNCHVGIKFLGKDEKRLKVVTSLVKSSCRLKHLE